MADPHLSPPDLPRLYPRIAVAVALAIAIGFLGVAIVDPWTSTQGLRLARSAAALPVAVRVLFDSGLWLFYVGFVALLVVGWWRRQRAWIAIVAAYLAAELVVAAGLVRLLKIACGRPRPYLGAVDWNLFSLASDFHSLPSGHAADVMVGFAVVELVSRSRWLKLVAGLVAVATVATRVLQGQHHLSDVAVGGLLGYLGGLAGVAALRRWRRGAPAVTCS